LPGIDKTKEVRVSRLFNSIDGVAATRSEFSASTLIGYGLVVRFD